VLVSRNIIIMWRFQLTVKGWSLLNTSDHIVVQIQFIHNLTYKNNRNNYLKLMCKKFEIWIYPTRHCICILPYKIKIVIPFHLLTPKTIAKFVTIIANDICVPCCVMSVFHSLMRHRGHRDGEGSAYPDFTSCFYRGLCCPVIQVSLFYVTVLSFGLIVPLVWLRGISIFFIWSIVDISLYF